MCLFHRLIIDIITGIIDICVFKLRKGFHLNTICDRKKSKLKTIYFQVLVRLFRTKEGSLDLDHDVIWSEKEEVNFN